MLQLNEHLKFTPMKLYKAERIMYSRHFFVKKMNICECIKDIVSTHFRSLDRFFLTQKKCQLYCTEMNMIASYRDVMNRIASLNIFNDKQFLERTTDTFTTENNMLWKKKLNKR